MKHLFTGLMLLLLIVMAGSLVFAGDKTIVDNVLQIPKCVTAPTIDGTLDPVWQYVTAVPMMKFESGSIDTGKNSYFDHLATYRAMWDDSYFYVFVHSYDDTILTMHDGLTTARDPWNSDCVELFFDGSNEKVHSYDANDRQWRYVYGEVYTDTGLTGNGRGEYAWKVDTVGGYNGYNLEVRIPKDSLTFPLAADQEIGFEVSNADRDNDLEGRANVLHWWTNDGNTWQYANLFGTAVLSAKKEAGDALIIPKIDIPPVIDGVMDAGEWDAANEISMLKPEAGYVSMPRKFGDHLASAFTMWDDNYFYVFAKVTDDTLLTMHDGLTTARDPWNSDCIELFFDGSNEKVHSYDANDRQWRYVSGEVYTDTGLTGNGRGEYVWKRDTVAGLSGFNFECRIPKDSLTFPLTTDQEIGFEISNADRDGDLEGRSHVLHWWTTDGNTWQYADLFGTAILKTTGATGVGCNDPSIAKSYRLEQNYPNPFNPSTRITYSLATSGQVKLTVHDVLGRQVVELVNGVKNPGTYTVAFDAKGLASGVYFYRLHAGGTSISKKMMLLK